VIAGPGIFFSGFDTQQLQILLELLDVLAGKVAYLHTCFFRPIDGFVIKVGDVHNVGHIIASIIEIPSEQVGENKPAALCEVNSGMSCQPT